MNTLIQESQDDDENIPQKFNKNHRAMKTTTCQACDHNSNIKYQRNVLMFTDWITGKILYVNDIKRPSGFIPFQDICNKMGNSPSPILEYNVRRAAVYTFVHSHNVCDTENPELSDRPLFCNRKINTAKDFRKALIFMHDSVRVRKASGAGSLD